MGDNRLISRCEIWFLGHWTGKFIVGVKADNLTREHSHHTKYVADLDEDVETGVTSHKATATGTWKVGRS